MSIDANRLIESYEKQIIELNRNLLIANMTIDDLKNINTSLEKILKEKNLKEGKDE